MKRIERILDMVPMYRLTLYYLGALWLVGILLGFLGYLPFPGFSLAFSGLFLMGVCGIVSDIYASFFGVPENHESALITALILSLIIPPAMTMSGLWFLAAAGIIAMSSKYILAIRGKHLFNPAAVAVAITALAFGQSATWWVGTRVMLPFVFIGGIFLVRKIRRLDAALSFIGSATVITLGYYLAHGMNLMTVLNQLFVNSGLFFLAFAMLTEPRTMPGTRVMRVFYGALVGGLFAPFVHLGSFFFTPELALVAGNAFSYLVSPKGQHVLRLIRRRELAPGIWDFAFQSDHPFTFKPGQYLEWTLGKVSLDNKGNRRYFTIASAPSEREIHLTVRLQNPLSAYKKALLSLQPGEVIHASARAGDFILPRDKTRKLAFIAGGIGITPFRSMIKHLLDTNDARDAALFYAARTPRDVVYRELFDAARARLGLKTLLAVSETNPQSGEYYRGRITPELLARAMPDWRSRTYYISGPETMVASLRRELRGEGIARAQIKTDYFPGFA